MDVPNTLAKKRIHATVSDCVEEAIFLDTDYMETADGQFLKLVAKTEMKRSVLSTGNYSRLLARRV